MLDKEERSALPDTDEAEEPSKPPNEYKPETDEFAQHPPQEGDVAAPSTQGANMTGGVLLDDDIDEFP